MSPSTTPVLHHERVTAPSASPERWLLVLHGIYGAGRNWGTVARRIVAERPDWGAALVDLRQHGASQGHAPPHTLAAAAGDLTGLVESEALAPGAVLGHSFGGKVALVWARAGDPSLRQLWIVDSTPEARAPSGSAWEMLAALREAAGPFRDRDEGIHALESQGVARPVAQWMGTNLVADEERLYRWRIEVTDMEALLLDFFDTDAWDVVERPPRGLELHFVKAEASSVLDEQACERIVEAGRENGRVHLHRVPGGHWLNADNPDAIVALLAERLPGGGA